MSELGKLALSGLTSGGVDTAVKTGGGLISSGLNYLFQKKLMKRQNAYNIAQWNREVKRQNELLNLQAQFTKNSLRNAGYSTANPEGMTTQATTSPSGQTPDIPSGGVHIEPDAGLLSQLRLQEAQTHELEASARAKEAEARQKEKYAELYEIYGEKEIVAALNKMTAEERKATEEALLADQQRLNSIVLTDAQEEQIRTMTKIEYDKLEPTLKLIAAETAQAEEAGKLNKAQAAKAYQDIKESQQKIENLKKDYELTDAEIAVANQELKKVQAEAAKKKWETKDAETRWMRNEFDRIAHEKLGWKWRMCAEFIDAFKPFVPSSSTSYSSVEVVK